MIKKIKQFINKIKEKNLKYWRDMDVDRELKIEQIKNSRSKRALIDYFGVGLVVLWFFLVVPFGSFIMSKIDYEALHKQANAEEINISNMAYEDILNDTTALVNFNQIINPADNLTLQYYTFSAGTYNFTSYSGWINTNGPFNVINGHKYFIHSICNTDISRISFTNNVDYGMFNHVANYIDILIPQQTKDDMLLLVNPNGVECSITLYLIDLSAMFGQNNEPNLEQCQELFVADYYPYNTGTTISLNGLNAYAEGVNSAISSVDNLVASPNDFYNSLQPFAYYDTTTYIMYAGALNHDNNNYILLQVDASIPNYSQYNVVKACALLPLVNSLVENNIVTIKGYAASNQGAGSTTQNYFSVYAFNNNRFIKIADSSIVGTQYSQPTYFEFDFKMPFTADTIYIVNNRDGYYYSYRDIVVSQKVFNFQLWQETSFNDGYKQAENLYKSQLAQYTDPTGTGYTAIYQQGYTAGMNAQSEEFALQYYTFPQFIGAIFDVPVRVLNSLLDFDVLGYNMKNLIFSILTISIILSIVRFILQKSGGE